MPMPASVKIEGLDELQKKLEDLIRMGKVPMTAYIGTDLTEPPYPYYLEYGTSRMPAYATARPAFDERYAEGVKIAGTVMGKLIESGKSGPEVTKVGLEAGALPISNGWKEHIQQGPVPSHQRRGDTVTNLSDTGTYGRSIFVKVMEDEG
jgi:hypothetical protein